MAYNIPRLTKQSEEKLYNKYNGYGVLFVKTGDREMQITEFNLAINGKFCTMNGTLLTERLNELSATIKEE